MTDSQAKNLFMHSLASRVAHAVSRDRDVQTYWEAGYNIDGITRISKDDVGTFVYVTMSRGHSQVRIFVDVVCFKANHSWRGMNE